MTYIKENKEFEKLRDEKLKEIRDGPKTTYDPKREEAKLSASADMMRLSEFPISTHPIFGGWMDIASKLSYSRVPFHYFSLMTVASMVLGTRVRSVLSGKSVYANLYTLLLGTSSVSGKSFAIDMVTDPGRFLPAIKNIKRSEITTVGGVVQPQSAPLIKMIVQNNKLMEPRMVQDLTNVSNHMLWLYDEAQGFFSGAANNNSSILPQLCLIYDGKTVSSKLSISKKKKGDDNDYEWSCEHPFASLLFAMTDDQFDKLASSEQSEGGFLPRFLIIYEQGGKVEENVNITTEQQIEINKLVNAVQYVAEQLSVLKENDISFNVCSRIEKWKVSETNKYLAPEFSDRRIAIQRAFVQAYKIAMILSIFDREYLNNVILKNKKENGGIAPVTLELPEKWVNEALSIVEKYLIPRMEATLQKANDVNAKSDMSKIIKVIKNNGGRAERHVIGRSTHIGAKMLDEALNSLVSNHELYKAQIKSVGGHMKTIYCLDRMENDKQ